MNEDQLISARDKTLDRLNDSLDSLAAKCGNSYTFALIDAKEFLFDFYVCREIRSSQCKLITSDDLASPNFCLNFKFTKNNNEGNVENVSGNVYFYGKGVWKYSFKVRGANKNSLDETHGEQSCTTYSYKGEGTKWRHPSKNGECNHIFSFINDLDKYLSIEENFKTQSIKLYSFNKGLRQWDDKVSPGWHIGYYDGPLSGFCYLHKRLHYFNIIEEKTFSGDRLFGLYPLTLTDKIRAYGLKFLWQQRIDKNRIKLYETIKFLFNPKKKYDTNECIGGFTY